MIKYAIFLIVNVFFLAACSPKDEGKTTIACGSKSPELQWQIRSNNSSTKRFAILLSGLPATSFFSDQNPEAARLADKLIDQGYKVFEARYPSGFIGACSRQGFENITTHCVDIYDFAVRKLGFDDKNSEHKLVGVGYSMGALQLQGMTFMRDRRMDTIVLSGILFGDVTKGCKSFLDNVDDGYSFKALHQVASMFTKNGRGCLPESEFTVQYNFENQKYQHRGQLGLFEGEEKTTALLQKRLAGNPGQAEHIEKMRQSVNAPVKRFSYPSCGHELMKCTNGKVVDDILQFIQEN